PITRASPSQTLAFRNSVRTSWLRISVGPGASVLALACAAARSCLSAITSLPVGAAVTRGPEIGSGAAGAQSPQPAQRIIPLGRAIGRKADDLGAPGDRVERNRAAEPLALDRHAAVGAPVAVVTHQEQMVGGHGDWTIIVGCIARA